MSALGAGGLQHHAKRCWPNYVRCSLARVDVSENLGPLLKAPRRSSRPARDSSFNIREV